MYLLLQHAVEDEDEHPLQGVEDGEEVSHDHRALVDVHEAEGPGQAQQAQQGDGTDHPGPGRTDAGGDIDISVMFRERGSVY